MEKEIKGHIVQIIGPVIDVAFEDEKHLPNLLDALVIKLDNGKLRYSRTSERTL